MKHPKNYFMKNGGFLEMPLINCSCLVHQKNTQSYALIQKSINFG